MSPRPVPSEDADSFLPLPTAVFHILVALADQERHGYAIMQDVAERTDGKVRLFVVTIKVQISRTEEDEAGNVEMGPPSVREGVRPLTPLPGEKAPVVTYLGPNFETGKALLMVSKEVTATFGEAQCVSGTASCERIRSASTPPNSRNSIVRTRYMIPIRLWSVVVSQANQPRGSDRGPRRAISGRAATDAVRASTSCSPPASTRAAQAGVRSGTWA